LGRLTLEDTTALTARCFYGEPASCSHGCPFFFDLRTFLARAAAGKWNLAYKLLRAAVLFPEVVSTLCPEGCRAECQRTHIGDEALCVRDIEAACLRLAKNKKPDAYRLPAKEKRVAVVGAGVAGLSCALSLGQKCYGVTVFEREEAWGGRLAGHAGFAAFDADFALQFSAVSTVEFAFGREIRSLDDLDGFDAVYVATGAGGADFGRLGLWDAELLTAFGSGSTDSAVDADCADGAGSAVDADGASGESIDKGGVFLGGELCGLDPMEAIACGARASKYIETWLMTGNAAQTGEEDGRALERHYLDHSGTPPAPTVRAADMATGYSKEEAEAEAARCMGCDCRRCLDACAMLATFKKSPKKIAIEAYTDTHTNPPFSSCQLTRETYSCSVCGHCKSVCPVDIDLGELFLLARKGRVAVGSEPKVFHDFWLREFDFSTGEAAWAKTDPGRTSLLFFPGCRLGAYSPELVLETYRLLGGDAGGGTADADACAGMGSGGEADAGAGMGSGGEADAGVGMGGGVGIVLDCCGAPLYWAGQEEPLMGHLARLRGLWEDAGKPVVALACAYCEKVFAELLPDIPRISVYEQLAFGGGAHAMPVGATARNLQRHAGDRGGRPCGAMPDGIAQGNASVPGGSASAPGGCASVPGDSASVPGGNASAPGGELIGDDLLAMFAEMAAGDSGQPYAVFDPCAAAEDIARQAAVRALAARYGILTEELPAAERGKCCGFGGHTGIANAQLTESFTEARAAVSGLPYLVSCANCQEAFARAGKPSVHILELVCGLAAPPSGSPPPTLREKNENQLRLRRSLMESSGMSLPPPEEAPWATLFLRFTEEGTAQAERHYMSEEEIREAVYEAERAGDYFREGDGEGEQRICSLVRPVVTYWIRYAAQAEDSAYKILGVYSHRMHFLVGEGG
jgi:Fe-S oxidoreductase